MEKLKILISYALTFLIFGFFLGLNPLNFLYTNKDNLSTNDVIYVQASKKIIDELELVTYVPQGEMPKIEPLPLLEVRLIAKMVHAEARGESFEGKMAVAEVILNRLKDHRFPNTILEVLYDPGQFSPVNNGSFENAIPTNEEILAVMRILRGESVVKDALFFYNPKTSARQNINWFLNSTKYINTIGMHEFRGL